MSKIKDLQQIIDELIVQLELGKLEAIESVEEAKRKLQTHLDKLSHSISQPLKQEMDDLRLQLKLGKMETQDAYFKQREVIETSLDKALTAMKKVRNETAGEFHEAAHTLKDKIRLLGFNLGLGVHVAAEEAGLTKEKLKMKLKDLASTIKTNQKLAGEKARIAAEESWEAFAEIRSNLHKLFKLNK
jgi:hypothetical protein